MKTNFFTKFTAMLIALVAMGISGNVWAQEHLPLSGKSYTIGKGSATDWTHQYETLSFTGVPDKLSFNYAYIYQVVANVGNPTLNYASLSGFAQFILGIGGYSDERKGVGNTHMLYIEESADGNSWSTIWTNDDATNMDTRSSGDIQLSKATRYIRFHHSCNFSNSYTNIKVTELKYVEDPEPATLDFGSAVINSGEVTKTSLINWCNISPLTVTCSNPRFTVTPTSFGDIDTYGSQTLTVTYIHTSETGVNEGDITISNGTNTKTIHVSANTTKRAQTINWNADLVATGYAMNTEEQYPDATIASIATATSSGRVTFTSDNSEVIEVIADTALLAKAVGTVNITAYQAGDAEYDEVSDTKLFTVTELLKQSIVWDQNLYGLLTTSGSVELTATATSGGPVTYTSANTDVVTVEGNILTIVGEGETYITASQAGGEIDGHEYLPISQDNYVIVRNPASQCNGMALSQSSLTLNGSKKQQDFKLSGIPAVLTFTAKHGEKNTSSWGSATYSALIVEQYIYRDGLWDWHEVYNNVVGTSDTQSGNISLDESATKLRFRTLETGTDHTITNIRVSRAKFLRANYAQIDENAEFNTEWSKKITVSHSNIDLMTLSATQGVFTLSRNTIGEGCGDFGDDEFTISFTPHEKNVDFFDTIIVTDNKEVPSTLRIPVHIFTTGLNQYINGFELPEAALTTEEIPAFTATATSGLEVIYLSSDSTIAYVKNNKLVVLSAGTVEITAYQAGDERYASASQTKTIVLSKTPVEIYTAPSASWIVAGETLAESVLTGGEASTEGSFAWLDPTIVPEAGEQTYTVRFIPAKEALYETASAEITVLVSGENKHDQTITWSDELPQFYMRDTLALTASATSRLEVYFTSSDSAVAYVDAENHLITLAVGEAIITAHQSGNNFYNPAEPVAKTVTVIPFPATYGEYTALVCEGDSVEYAGVWYREAVVTEVTLAGANYLGGDSIVTLTVSRHQPYAFEETKMIYVAAEETWENINLATLPVGDTTLVAEYHSIYGCDSVYTLHLTVMARPTTYGDDTLYVCAGETVEYAGKTYKRPAHDSVRLAGVNYLGGDSIVALVVYVRPVMRIVSRDTIVAGTEKVWQGYDLSTVGIGDTTIVAEYSSIYGCDSTYMLHLTVKPRIITYGAETILACSGETVEYEGRTYNRSATDTIVLSGQNYAGGDSIVTLVVSFSQPFSAESNLTITEGDKETWQGLDLSAMEVGDTILVAEYTSIYGCDSTYTLHLTVEPRIITYGADTIRACSGETVEYEGRTYNRSATDTIVLSGQNYAGGDSIVALAVIFSQPFLEESILTITEGDAATWQGIDLSGMPVGDTTLVAGYTSFYGCDSTYTLHLTVEPRIITYGADTIYACSGEIVEYEGRTYSRSATDTIVLSGQNYAGGDSIVALEVIFSQPFHSEAYKMIKEGENEVWQEIDLSLLPVGDTILVAEYQTLHGCDSVYTLYLIVEPKTEAVPFTNAEELNVQKVLIDNAVYIRKGDELFDLRGRKVNR